MSVKFMRPPDSSKRALLSGLNLHELNVEFNNRKRLPNRSFIETPHIVYFARLDHLRSGFGLRYARPKAWRYFLRLADHISFALAEVNIDGKGQHTFAFSCTGLQINAHRALLNSTAQDASHKESFAFRLLRIPSIHVFAVWLRSNRPGRDIIIPVVPDQHFLIDRHFYPRREFEQILEREAKRRKNTTATTN